MKKGRPGTLLTVICDPDRAASLAERILDRTSTLGVRSRTEARVELPRSAGSVDTPWGSVRIKWIRRPGGWEAAPEADDLAACAIRAGRPLRVVAEAVGRAAASLEPPPGSPGARSD
jgi:uncharacterized protein (DUF111 family)